MSTDKEEFELFESQLFESAKVSEPAKLKMPTYIFLAEESLETLVKQMNQKATEGYRLASELKTVASPHTLPATPMWTVVMEFQEPITPYIPEIKLALMLYDGGIEVEVENASPVNGFEA